MRLARTFQPATGLLRGLAVGTGLFVLASAGFGGSIARATATRTPTGTTQALAAAHRQHDAIERTIASLQSRVHGLDAARDRLAARLSLPGALNPVSAPALYVAVARELPLLAEELVRTREALMHLDRRRRQVAGRIERLRARFFREWERRREERAREAEKAPSAATRVAVPAAPSIPPASGTFQACPVPGGSYRDSFGILSMRGGAHIHQGIDVFASYGTPVRAPFAGRAEVATNSVGGLAVKVFGPAGYVYNAHLAASAPPGRCVPVTSSDSWEPAGSRWAHRRTTTSSGTPAAATRRAPSAC